MRTCIKARLSLNLGQMPPLTMELAALEHLKNRRHHFVSVAIEWERGGSVVECRTPEREVRGSKPTAAVLCP